MPLSGDEKLADGPNEYFSTVALQADHQPASRSVRNLIFGEDPCLCELFVTEDEVLCELSLFDSFEPPGPDGIPPQVQKNFRSMLYKPMTVLLYWSLSSGIFLGCLKDAIVTSIPKKTKKEVFNDFRPIYVVSSLSKVFEKLVRRGVERYLDVTKLWNPHQSGFRKY